MDRRELLKMIAMATGSVVVGGEIFLAGGCNTEEKAAEGSYFTPSEIALLNEVGETILPATATPGAKAAQVGEFMNVYVRDCYAKEAQDAFKKGLGQLDDLSDEMHNTSFMKATPEQRKQTLLKLEEESKSYNKVLEDKDKPARESAKQANKEYDFVPSTRHYYTMMKQLTLIGFFTSKVGATQALRPLPIPGKYDGAYPYKKGDRAFSS